MLTMGQIKYQVHEALKLVKVADSVRESSLKPSSHCLQAPNSSHLRFAALLLPRS